MKDVLEPVNAVTTLLRNAPPGGGNPIGVLISTGALLLAMLSAALTVLPKMAPLLTPAIPAPAPVLPGVPTPIPSPVKALNIQCPYCRNVFKVQVGELGELPKAATVTTSK